MTTVLTEVRVAAAGPSSPRMKMRMLAQMAEALEDQVAALYRRAAAFEEEEFLVNREIEERQTEINRMLLKLELMRADRDRVMERIESISHEAAALREEVFDGEEDVALRRWKASPSKTSTEPRCDGAEAAFNAGSHARGPTFSAG